MSRGRPGHAAAPAARGPEGAASGPVRTCVGCRARRPAAELTRLAVAGDDGRPRVVADPRARAPGRGAWVCSDDASCLAKALLKGRLAKALRVPDPDLEALRGRIS